MCGIVGFLAASPSTGAVDLAATAARMSHRLIHRGPDSGSVWVDEAAGVGLGHRRLAILDLSETGAQPMFSASGRFVVTYNGEIYNYASLRQELSALGHSFRGESDTEVLLAAAEQWGLIGALTRFNGMFAFAIWDRKERILSLARDRMGEKPLYYGWFRGTFLFGSEVKAIRAHPDFEGEVDRDALAAYMLCGYVPAPQAIHQGLRKLGPAGLLTVRAGGPPDSPPERYWSYQAAAVRGIENPSPRRREEAVDELESLLREAVKLRMRSDVPLGAFLSGGIDSSTVVALMQAESARPVKTFTIGFREGGFDETHHAAAVARHLGTEHTELYLEARDALDVIPLLPVLYDEPFADSSQIPTFLVSRLARRHVTVSLSGDGGDELFCGYRHYKVANDISRFLRWIPPGVGKSAGRALEAILGGARGLLAPRRPAWLDRLESGAKVLQLPTTDALARWMVSQRIDPTAFVLGSAEPRPPPDDEPEFPRLAELLMYRDGLAYLPDGVLVKVDRASMGVSLESRAPLLDHRVVEMAWRLPFDFKLRDGEGKWVLRQVLYRHVPRELVERPKMGFSVPVGAWLRGPLTEWAHDLLSEDRLNREGYLAPSLVSQVLREHLSGKDWSQLLWNFLMFETWLDDAARPPSGTGAAPGTEVTHGAGLPVHRTDS